MALLTSRRFVTLVGLFALFALAAACVAPLVGAEPVSAWRAVGWWLRGGPAGERPVAVDIFFFLRLPRILLAFLAGATLAVVGAVFQALLRNSLATPYTLGVDSGGSLGAVVAIFLPTRLPWLAFHWGPFSQVQLFSFFGSSLAVFMIYLLAQGRGRISTLELLLAGVTMGSIFSALILAVRYFASPELLVSMDRWTMGGLDVTGYENVLALLPLLLPGLVILFVQARGFDQIVFGEELAQGRGVNVQRLQKLAFFGGSLATSSIVAVSGPIGFVGLIVPHAVRALVGPDHRLLLPCVFFAGGGFLILCDTFARTIIAPTELPVGIITSLLGGPFFIYLLIRMRRGAGAVD